LTDDHADIRIVISYRRQDTPGGAGRLRESLADRFGRDNVFLDIDAIPPGVPWRQAIEKTIQECNVLLPVIGVHWLSVADEQGGRRLDDPNDVLRFEIANALKAGVRIIPIQLHGAAMPGREELPEEIAGLADYQSIRIDDDDWRDDMRKLVRALERIRAEITGVDVADSGDGTPQKPTGEADRAAIPEAAPAPAGGRLMSWLRPLPPDASEAQRAKRRRLQIWGYALGAFSLLLACIPTDEDEAEYGTGGAFFGNLAVGLGVALLLRLAYVKLVRRGRPFWSPWILAIAFPIALASRNS
jgi:TIR domain